MKNNDSPNFIMEVINADIIRLNLTLTNSDLDRCHRVGNIYTFKLKSQQDVLLKFSTWRARNTFYQHRKLLNFVVSPDLTSRRESVLSFAREEINGCKGDDMAAVTKIVDFAVCDINCKLKFKSRLNKFDMFSSAGEFLNRRINIYEESTKNDIFY